LPAGIQKEIDMVKNLAVTSVTNKDGKLSLSNLDIGPADKEVRVFLVVNDLSRPPLSDSELAEWNLFVDRTEGRIDDPTFKRHDQGTVRTILSFDGDE
ncbi:MAG TPA: hypothetical protein VHM90_03060, partial [Phycisphaerae bacterium]|nr:hypothetical protein [Phycisphaerae bacterium]